MTDAEKEYEKYFTKFYSDLFKFKNGTKSSLRCPGCETNKRFIIDHDTLTFSCGPKNNDNKKCGPQYTIQLPKYDNFRDLHKIYNEQINGSFVYKEKDHLQYDLKSLTMKMNVKDDLEKQTELIKDSQDKLKKLINDTIKENKLSEYTEILESLSDKRYKNSIEKQKIMRSLKEEELSEPEQKELRKKYAVLIQENKEFINMIIELRKTNTDYIMSKKPEIIIHNKHKEDKEKDKDKDKEDKAKDKEDKKEDKEESLKKYTFDDQVRILTEYYKEFDPNKTENDIKRIINNRRPKGSQKGTILPTKPWLELCDKLQKKYVYHPLRMKEEKEKFIQELEDGSEVLVDFLSPGSPR